ncbi:hypothetical protein Q3G72_015039 [Acer saccharum]|nr:hypothetical protein Q3G72_015039 [Acer saccharum]
MRNSSSLENVKLDTKLVRPLQSLMWHIRAGEQEAAAQGRRHPGKIFQRTRSHRSRPPLSRRDLPAGKRPPLKAAVIQAGSFGGQEAAVVTVRSGGENEAAVHARR